MKPKYNSYKLKSDDTLKSVAKKLGLSIQEAKNFHNIFSKEHEIIIDDFPAGLQSLNVYPYIYEKIEDKSDFVKFAFGYTLNFTPSLAKRFYNVMYGFENQNQEISTLKFQRSLQFKGKDNDFTYYEVDKIGPVYVNDEEASELADELAVKAASAIYPLGCVIDRTGKLVDIFNFEEIQKRWKKVRQEILEEYEGQWVNDYLDACEQSIEEKESLQLSLSNDYFLNGFFSGIYVDYTPDFTFNNNVIFPVLAHKLPLKYEVKQKVNAFLDDYQLVAIEQEGFLNEERSKLDIENNLNFPYHNIINPDAEMAKGNFKANYFLDGKNNLISSFRINCSIEIENARKIEIVASLVED